jgi:hypothetical protein
MSYFIYKVKIRLFCLFLSIQFFYLSYSLLFDCLFIGYLQSIFFYYWL